MRQPFTINTHHITITASIGLASYPDTSHHLDTLLHDADHAMYQAKRDGKNRYHFYD